MSQRPVFPKWLREIDPLLVNEDSNDLFRFFRVRRSRRRLVLSRDIALRIVGVFCIVAVLGSIVSTAFIWKAMAVGALAAIAALLGTILMGLEPRGTDLGSSVRDVFAIWNTNSKVAEELWQTGVTGRQVIEAAYLEAREEQVQLLPLILLGAIGAADVALIYLLLPSVLEWTAIIGAIAIGVGLYMTGRFYLYAMIAGACHMVVFPMLKHWSLAKPKPKLYEDEKPKRRSGNPNTGIEDFPKEQMLDDELRPLAGDQRFIEFLRTQGDSKVEPQAGLKTYRLNKRSFALFFAALLFCPVWLPNIGFIAFAAVDYGQLMRLLDGVPNLDLWFNGWFLCAGLYALVMMLVTRWQRERSLLYAVILFSRADEYFSRFMSAAVLQDPDYLRPDEDKAIADELEDMKWII